MLQIPISLLSFISQTPQDRIDSDKIFLGNVGRTRLSASDEWMSIIGDRRYSRALALLATNGRTIQVRRVRTEGRGMGAETEWRLPASYCGHDFECACVDGEEFFESVREVSSEVAITPSDGAIARSCEVYERVDA